MSFQDQKRAVKQGDFMALCREQVSDASSTTTTLRTQLNIIMIRDADMRAMLNAPENAGVFDADYVDGANDVRDLGLEAAALEVFSAFAKAGIPDKLQSLMQAAINNPGAAAAQLQQRAKTVTEDYGVKGTIFTQPPQS